MNNLKMSSRTSLNYKILLRITIIITVIIASTTFIWHAHLTSVLESETKVHLEKYIIERGQRESDIFKLAQDNLTLFKKEFQQRLKESNSQDYEQAFEKLFTKWSDGTTRNQIGDQAIADFDTAKYPTVFIDEQIDINDDIRQRVVVAYELLSNYAPAWMSRFVNTYFLTPENIVVNYWPGEAWGLTAEADLDIRNEEYFYVSDKEHNPNRQPAWTGIYFDHVVNLWMVSLEIPIDDEQGRHIATVGQDIILNKLIERTLNSTFVGTHNIIIRADGRLIAEPDKMDAIKKQAGNFDILESNDQHLINIFNIIKNMQPNQIVVEDELHYLAVTKIEGPDWYFVIAYPKALIEKKILKETILIIILGFILLIVIIFVLFIILRSQVIKPLHKFVNAAQQIAGGNFNLNADIDALLTSGSEELWQLADSFQNMSKQLKGSFETLENKNVVFNNIILDVVQVSTGLANGDLNVRPKAVYDGDYVEIKKALQTVLSNQRQVIEDITQVSQGLATGNLSIVPKAEYNGDFIQIKAALQIALLDIRKVITDIVKVSRGLVEGENIKPNAKYQGDFIQIKQALEMASNKLTEATNSKITQDWLKNGQTKLNEQIAGEQEIVAMSKKIISFLTTYTNAQIGIFYILVEEEGQKYTQIVASYAYIHDIQITNKTLLTEGLVGQSVLEQKVILRTQSSEECPAIVSSGLARTLPKYIILLPFLYENEVKGVIEIGSTKELTKIQYDFLETVMPNIGIAVNTANSRTQTQNLLKISQQQAKELQLKQQEMQQTNEELQSQSAELQNQQEELQTQQEELRQTNEVLEERTRSLKQQKSEIQEKNQVLEQTRMEMQKTQETITIKAQELELASKYKSEFLSNMSHELRTPLNSLLILAQLLSENKTGNLNEKQVEYAKTMHSAGKDLLTLINDILDLSKVEAGKIEIHWENVEINDLLTEIKQKFEAIAENKNLEFDVTLSSELSANLMMDGQRVKQIINNLLSNAFKFTSKGKIELLIKYPTKVPVNLSNLGLEANKIIAISVIDTGIGIPKDKQQVIFEAFQQADGSTNRRFGGTGLGLSISRQLARLMGGELTLISNEGQGSIFSLYLPQTEPNKLTTTDANPSNQQSDVPSAVKSLTNDSNKVTENYSELKTIFDKVVHFDSKDKSLLIIEDDENFSKILIELAQEKNFKCLLAEDGISGLRLAIEHQPKAIILDINLPRMDGWDVMEKLKGNPDTRHIPVHFMSANDKTLAAKKMGAIGFLLKPITTEDLHVAFKQIEQFLSKTMKNLLLITDTHQQEIMKLVAGENIQIRQLSTTEEVLPVLKQETYDCIILDFDIEQGSGSSLLEKICENRVLYQNPVIIYADRDLTSKENNLLIRCAKEMPIKSVNSSERLLDEVSLFLHQITAEMPTEKRNMLKMIHNKTEIIRDKIVLLVDDDMRNSFALTTVLEEYEMEVIIAENGKEALAKLKQHDDIAIVLMDIMMPEMDGYETMKKIRQNVGYHKLPIIALTAKAMKDDKAKCIEAGANDYLAKPVDTDKLLSLMRVWLYK